MVELYYDISNCNFVDSKGSLMKLFVNRKVSFLVKDKSSLSSAMAFLENNMKEYGGNQKFVIKNLLIIEEAVALLLDKAHQWASLRVQFKKTFTDIEINLSVEGEEMNPYETMGFNSDYISINDDIEAQNVIRSIILKAQGDNIKYTHKDGANHIRIEASQTEKTMLKSTMITLALGILFGLLMNGFFPESTSGFISKYALSPIKTMFMNALKMVIAPVVFFSIVSCFSQFKSMTELGKIGAKVISIYVCTTVIAIIIALTVSLLLKPGEFGFALSLAATEVNVNTDMDTSILSMIVGIIPSNFFLPFVEADTLQIIFLAVVCGIAVGMIGEYSGILKDFFEACNSLFLTITELVTKFIPLAVFCTAALMVIELGGKSFLNVLSMAATIIALCICMILVYCLMVLVLAKLNPVTFIKKNREGMMTSLALCSSSAAMPTNMKTCTDKLGISPKVCSFSIPLGATLNMDGTSIIIVVASLFLARAYGVEVPASAIMSLSVTIMLLSMGSPGVPGAGMVCIGIILESLGVPIEAIGLIIGIYPIIDMFATMSNTTGDVAAALIVAKSERLLDIDKFNE